MYKKFKLLKIFYGLLTLVVLMNSSTAWSKWDWITETAISQFTEQDINVLKEAGRDALNNQTDDSVVHWSNPETGNSGSIKVTDTRDVNGLKCRTTHLKNKTESIQGQASYLVCQQDDGNWKITTPPKK